MQPSSYNIIVTKNISNKGFVSAILLVSLIYATCAFVLLYLYSSKNQIENNKNVSYLGNKGKKYILQWQPKFQAPFEAMGKGNRSFISKKCKFTNCIVTDNVIFLSDVTQFDAIVFDIRSLRTVTLPKNRSYKQMYIFGAMESPANYPMCDEIFDNYFNWTWSYKLDSDFRWGYITIYDLAGNIVGPAIDMEWLPEFKPISDELKNKLQSKSKAAAWFVSRCHTKSGRHKFATEIQIELKKYGLDVDIYGNCGPLKCPKQNKTKCSKMIENDYYFYFSFENSFAEDYVTEKLLIALHNYAVPVVYGGADYSRFLPSGSYLDSRKLGPKELALQMTTIIGNRSRYYDFFRWRNHYLYENTGYTEDICNLCAMMNYNHMIEQKSSWAYFRSWWNGEQYENICSDNN